MLDEAELSHPEMAARLGCSVATVVRTMRALGWRSVKGHGSPLERNHFWRGGRSIDSDGYVLVKVPEHPNANNNGYVREHRLVMEQSLGRLMTRREVVHHKDGDRANNHLHNLELHQSNGDHLREHMADGSIPRCKVTGRLVTKAQSPEGRQPKGQHQSNASPKV